MRVMSTKDKQMGKEGLAIRLKVTHMKDIGRETFPRVMVSKYGLEHLNTKVTFALELKKELDSTEDLDNLNIVVVSEMINSKDWVD